jgi:hypothetical protein
MAWISFQTALKTRRMGLSRLYLTRLLAYKLSYRTACDISVCSMAAQNAQNRLI